MHSVSGPDPIMCLQTWVAFQKKKQKKSTECRTAGCQLQVGFEELAESFRQHLASFTNKWSPQRFKVRLISFWDSAQNTGILNIESGASPWKPSISPPCPLPPTHTSHPPLEWCGERDPVEFSTSSIFTHSSWILAANSRLYYWMDVLLCHREDCLKWNFKLE